MTCKYCAGAKRIQIVSSVSDHAWADCFCNRPAELALAATEHDRMRAALIDTAAHLAAAISLLERAPATIAPSKKMFDQMKRDYLASLGRARSVLNRDTQS